MDSVAAFLLGAVTSLAVVAAIIAYNVNKVIKTLRVKLDEIKNDIMTMNTNVLLNLLGSGFWQFYHLSFVLEKKEK